MDTAPLSTMLDTLSALRVDAAGLPDAKLAAILHNLDPESAERIRGVVAEFDERKAHLDAEITTLESAIKTAVLATGAGVHGTYLQAIIMAPRITWDNKSMQVYSAMHPEVLAYRKVGEPSVQIRARSLKG